MARAESSPEATQKSAMNHRGSAWRFGGDALPPGLLAAAPRGREPYRIARLGESGNRLRCCYARVVAVHQDPEPRDSESCNHDANVSSMRSSGGRPDGRGSAPSIHRFSVVDHSYPQAPHARVTTKRRRGTNSPIARKKIDTSHWKGPGSCWVVLSLAAGLSQRGQHSSGCAGSACSSIESRTPERSSSRTQRAR